MQDGFDLRQRKPGRKEVAMLWRCSRCGRGLSIFRSVCIVLFKEITADFKLVRIILECILILFEHGQHILTVLQYY